jgi:uncharacterized protein YbjT (DUF2867 family)
VFFGRLKNMNILIFGATGTVGAEVVREAIKDNNIGKIAAVTRRPLHITHPKPTVIEHEDYFNYSPLVEAFRSAGACVWCLGVSQSQVSKEEYYKITHGYTIAAAKAIREVNPHMTFIFLSGAGTGPNAKTLFGKVKYETEQDLETLGFAKLYIARPAGIEPIHINKHTALTNKIVAPFFPIIKLFLPGSVITSVQVAKALLKLAQSGFPETILNTQQLKQLAA